MLRVAGRTLGLLLFVGCFLSVVFYQSASAITTGSTVELVVPDTKLTVSGRAAPGAHVSVKDGPSLVATTVADGAGNFSASITVISGIHQISTYYDDTALQRSATTSFSVSVQPQQNLPVSTFLSPTIVKGTPSPAQVGSIVQVRGYTFANSDVVLNVNHGSYTEVVQSNSAGFYEFLVDSNNLGEGIYTAFTRSSFGSEQSDISKSINFEIQNVSGPTTPDITVSPDQLPPPIVLVPIDGAVIENDGAIIRGESIPGAQINVYENDLVIGSTLVDEFGKWSFSYTAKFTPVTINFEACVDSRCSILSRSITLSFTRLDDCDVDFRLGEYRLWDVREGEAVSLSILEPSNGKVLGISWGDGVVEEFDNISGPIDIKKTYAVAGSYSGTVTIKSDDCERTRYFTASVSNKKLVNQTLRIFWLLLIVLLMFVMKQIVDNDRQRPIHRH